MKWLQVIEYDTHEIISSEVMLPSSNVAAIQQRKEDEIDGDRFYTRIVDSCPNWCDPSEEDNAYCSCDWAKARFNYQKQGGE